MRRARVRIRVRQSHAAEWISDLWIMQSNTWRGRRVSCCSVLMRTGRDGLQSTPRVTARTAGSRTINRACAEFPHLYSHLFTIIPPSTLHHHPHVFLLYSAQPQSCLSYLPLKWSLFTVYHTLLRRVFNYITQKIQFMTSHELNLGTKFLKVHLKHGILYNTSFSLATYCFHSVLAGYVCTDELKPDGVLSWGNVRFSRLMLMILSQE